MSTNYLIDILIDWYPIRERKVLFWIYGFYDNKEHDYFQAATHFKMNWKEIKAIDKKLKKIIQLI